MTKKPIKRDTRLDEQYDLVLGDISDLIDAARRSAARSVNSIMTAAYWLIGRRIVDYEQGGKARAGYGVALLGRLSEDLSDRYGRGFGVVTVRARDVLDKRDKPPLCMRRESHLGRRSHRIPNERPTCLGPRKNTNPTSRFEKWGAGRPFDHWFPVEG